MKVHPPPLKPPISIIAKQKTYILKIITAIFYYLYIIIYIYDVWFGLDNGSIQLVSIIYIVNYLSFSKTNLFPRTNWYVLHFFMLWILKSGDFLVLKNFSTLFIVLVMFVLRPLYSNYSCFRKSIPDDISK